MIYDKLFCLSQKHQFFSFINWTKTQNKNKWKVIGEKVEKKMNERKDIK